MEQGYDCTQCTYLLHTLCTIPYLLVEPNVVWYNEGMEINIGYTLTLPPSRTLENKRLAVFFGYQLKEFRYQLKLSREALARKTGFSESSIRHYEQGRRTPSYRFLCSLREAFGIPIDYFLPLDEMDCL